MLRRDFIHTILVATGVLAVNPGALVKPTDKPIVGRHYDYWIADDLDTHMDLHFTHEEWTKAIKLLEPLQPQINYIISTQHNVRSIMKSSK